MSAAEVSVSGMRKEAAGWLRGDDSNEFSALSLRTVNVTFDFVEVGGGFIGGQKRCRE